MLAIELNCSLNQLLHLVKLKRFLDTEAGFPSCPPSVSSILLNLGAFESHLLDRLLAYPGGHDLRPTVSFQESYRRVLVRIRAYLLGVNIFPVILARTESPRNFEVDIIVFFLGLDGSRSFYRETADT